MDELNFDDTDYSQCETGHEDPGTIIKTDGIDVHKASGSSDFYPCVPPSVATQIFLKQGRQKNAK